MRTFPSIVLVFLLGAGCLSLPWPAVRPSDDHAIKSDLLENLESLYPKSFRAVHRVILTAAGRQYDLNGYLIVRRPSDARLVATGDMGGKAFEIVARRERGFFLLHNAAGLRPQWLERGAFRDLCALYLSVPGRESTLVEMADGRYGLETVDAEGRRALFVFDTQRRLCAYWGENLLIEYGGYGKTASWPNPVPLSIRICDHFLGYEARIRVLDMGPTPLDDSRFQGGGAVAARR